MTHMCRDQLMTDTDTILHYTITLCTVTVPYCTACTTLGSASDSDLTGSGTLGTWLHWNHQKKQNDSQLDRTWINAKLSSRYILWAKRHLLRMCNWQLSKLHLWYLMINQLYNKDYSLQIMSMLNKISKSCNYK